MCVFLSVASIIGFICGVVGGVLTVLIYLIFEKRKHRRELLEEFKIDSVKKYESLFLGKHKK